MQRSSASLRVTVTAALALCGLLDAVVSWTADFYVPPRPSNRYITLSAPLFPTSPEACDALQQEFWDIQQELRAQHDQCLRDAPDQEHGDDGGTCSKSSCQSLHTARDKAGKNAQQEVGTCRKRVNSYLDKERREDERARRDAEEDERDRREQDLRDQDREREQRNAEQNEKDERERQAVQEKAEQERRDAEDRAQQDRQDQEERVRRDQQRYALAVMQTAGQLKATWQDRIRNALPDTASDLSREGLINSRFS